MKAYDFLSKLPFTKSSFSLKIILVAFVGIHIPLFGIIGYLLNTQMPDSSAWSIGLLTLIMTLVATSVTIFILNKLLKPVLRAKEALIQFKEFSKIPDLPTHYADEAGVLMREVQQTIESLARIEEERENLIHILRHDLQGPINNSLSILDLVKVDKLDEEWIDSLQANFKVQRQRLLTSIDYIKSQRNLQARKESMELISIKKLLEDAIENVQFESEVKNIDLKLMDLQDEELLLPRVILDRVATNLLDNAIKHSPSGSTVWIDALVNKGLLRISIQDSGEGIPDSVLPNLFTISQSKSKEYDPQKPSMGIGLYLCQKLMHSVGGRVVASNYVSSSGATFQIEYVLSAKGKE